MFTFKSKVTDLLDFKQVDLSQYATPFTFPPEKLEHDLLLIRKKHADMVDVKQVEEGDFVTLSCTSSLKKFNKESITVCVGKKLYSRELEEQLIGMNISEEKELTVDGTPVSVSILKIARNILPEVTDEIAAKWNVYGTTTVADLQQAVLNKAREEYIEDTAESVAIQVLDEVKARSHFILDEEELAQAKIDGEKMALSMLIASDIDLDTVTDEELVPLIGRTKQDHFDFVIELCIDELHTCVAGNKLMNENHIDITEDEYKAAFPKYMEATGASEEKAREDFTFHTFAKQTTANYYFDEIENHVKKYLETEF